MVKIKRQLAELQLSWTCLQMGTCIELTIDFRVQKGRDKVLVMGQIKIIQCNTPFDMTTQRLQITIEDVLVACLDTLS